VQSTLTQLLTYGCCRCCTLLLIVIVMYAWVACAVRLVYERQEFTLPAQDHPHWVGGGCLPCIGRHAVCLPGLVASGRCCSCGCGLCAGLAGPVVFGTYSQVQHHIQMNLPSHAPLLGAVADTRGVEQSGSVRDGAGNGGVLASYQVPLQRVALWWRYRIFATASPMCAMHQCGGSTQSGCPNSAPTVCNAPRVLGWVSLSLGVSLG
jgi:hypothetical protein